MNLHNILFSAIPFFSPLLIGSMESGPLLHQWTAKKYDANSQPQYEQAIQDLTDHVDWNKQTHIIDIGCGSGNICAYMAQQSPQALVEGFDVSTSMIELAKQKHLAANICFFTSDAATLPDKVTVNNTTLVTCFACLHWIKDKKPVFDAASKTLKKDGIFLARSSAEKWAKHPLGRTVFKLKETVHTLKNISIDQQGFPYDEKEAEMLVVQSGLTPIQITKENRKLLFSNEIELEKWFNGWAQGIPAIVALSKEQQNKLIPLIIKTYVEVLRADDIKQNLSEKDRSIKEDGSIVHTSHQVFVKAVKQ